MADCKCRHQYQYLFPVLYKVNGCKGGYEQQMIHRIQADDVLPAQNKIKCEIIHIAMQPAGFVVFLQANYYNPAGNCNILR